MYYVFVTTLLQQVWRNWNPYPRSQQLHFWTIKTSFSSWSTSYVRCWSVTQALFWAFLFPSKLLLNPLAKWRSPSPYGAFPTSKMSSLDPIAEVPCHKTLENLLFFWEQWHWDLFKFSVSFPSEKTGILEECDNSSLCCLW